MKLNELKPSVGSTKDRKRVGRGESSGHGKYAGRGNSGQKSRSGGSISLSFEGGQTPFFRRVPKKGFSNFPFKELYSEVNVEELEEKFNDGDIVNKETLMEKRIVRRKKLKVKILGRGDLNKKLIVTVDKVSGSAKEKIENAKGSVELL